MALILGIDIYSFLGYSKKDDSEKANNLPEEFFEEDVEHCQTDELFEEETFEETFEDTFEETFDQQLNMPEEKNDNNPSQYQCSVCPNKMLGTKHSLNRHMLKLHRIPADCSYCAKIFTNSKDYQDHIDIHKLTCTECEQTFSYVKKLKEHTKWTHTNAEKTACPQCGILVRYLNNHIKNKHSTAEERICTLCDYSNKDIKQVEKHFRHVHTEDTIETCKYCGTVTKDLYKHLHRIQCDKKDEDKRVYKCDDCVRTFPVNSWLKSHQQSVHLKLKNKHCPHCEYKTYRSTNLGVHIERVHKGLRKSKETCLYCENEYFNLSFHIRTYHPTK